MSVERYTFDTNILFYALDATDPTNHSCARALLNSADPNRVPILLQTLGEVSNSIIKRRPDLLDAAHRMVQTLSVLHAVVPADFEDVAAAFHVNSKHHLQF